MSLPSVVLTALWSCEPWAKHCTATRGGHVHVNCLVLLSFGPLESWAPTTACPIRIRRHCFCLTSLVSMATGLIFNISGQTRLTRRRAHESSFRNAEFTNMITCGGTNEDSRYQRKNVKDDSSWRRKRTHPLSLSLEKVLRRRKSLKRISRRKIMPSVYFHPEFQRRGVPFGCVSLSVFAWLSLSVSFLNAYRPNQPEAVHEKQLPPFLV